MPRLLLMAAVLTLLLASCGGSTSSTIVGTTTSTTAESTTTPSTTTTAVGSTTASTVATTTSGATTSSTGTTASGGDLLRIKIEDGVKTEGVDTISVRVGETVRFEVEADIADEIHVHGYDLTFETIPDEEILVEFVADATGIFEVELEGLGLPIVDIEVTP